MKWFTMAEVYPIDGAPDNYSDQGMHVYITTTADTVAEWYRQILQDTLKDMGQDMEEARRRQS